MVFNSSLFLFCQPFPDGYVEPEIASTLLLLKSTPEEPDFSEANDLIGQFSETSASAEGEHVIENLWNQVQILKNQVLAALAKVEWAVGREDYLIEFMIDVGLDMLGKSLRAS